MRRLWVARVAVAATALALLPAWLLPCAAANAGAAPVAESMPDSAHYVLLQVISPKQDETVHDNAGNTAVEVRLQPRLRTRQGDRLRVVLDDVLLPGVWRATQFSLQGVDRGRHTLQVVVTDTHDRRLIESEPVAFNMWQASRLLPNRGSTP